MPKVNLITAPDQLYNQNISMLLIDPKDLIKNDFNELLKTLTKDINLYLWETKDDANDYKWLIQVANSVDKIIIDLDYASLDRWLIGYFLSPLCTLSRHSCHEPPSANLHFYTQKLYNPHSLISMFELQS